MLLENLRFHPEEEKNDPEFAKQLASLTDLYVNDAFGAAHRAHASVEAITHHVPKAAAGLLMEKELEYLGRVLDVARSPAGRDSRRREGVRQARGDSEFSGARRSAHHRRRDGVHVSEGARRRRSGRSLVEDDKLDVARDIEAKAKARGLQFGLPVDHVVAEKLEAGAPSETLDVGDPTIGDRMGLDIGPKTIAALRGHDQGREDRRLERADGRVRDSRLREGHQRRSRSAVADVKGTTIVGGGDSIAAVNQAGIADRITHISTGGGASLEFLGGRKLPGVEALTDK